MAHVQKVIYNHRIFNEPIAVPGMRPWYSAVAALTEVNANDGPFLGDATMKVYNVVPHDDMVEVRGEIDWDSNIRVRITVIYEG